MEDRKSDSLVELIDTVGNILGQVGDSCAENLARHVAAMASAAAPLGDGAGIVVDGHRSALRSFAVASGVGAVLEMNADHIGAAVMGASADGALEEVFGAAIAAWQKHGDAVGVPFPGGGVAPDADFDSPPDRCDCDFCKKYGCHCDNCQEGVAAKESLPLGPLGVMEMWKACGETPEGWFAVVDRLKGEKVAP